MSSGEIMAIIIRKQEELKALLGSKSSMITVSVDVGCMANKYRNAGALIAESGNIGGSLFDNGATSNVGNVLSGISSSVDGVLSTINASIASLQDEINSLYAEYQAALAREAAMAENAERRRK